MPVARKTKTGNAVYGRQATAAEQTRFKKFAIEDRERGQKRLAADVQALEQFVTILNSVGGFQKRAKELVMVTGRPATSAKKAESAKKVAAKRGKTAGRGAAKTAGAGAKR